MTVSIPYLGRCLVMDSLADRRLGCSDGGWDVVLLSRVELCWVDRNELLFFFS